MLKSAKPRSLLDLPVEVRTLIYTEHFLSAIIHADFSPKHQHEHKLLRLTTWLQPEECHIHPALNITFTSKSTRRDSLPLFYQYATFDFSACSTDSIATNNQDTPVDVLNKLYRLRGNYDLLYCLRMTDEAFSLGRTPWPDLQIETLPLRELTISISISAMHLTHSAANTPSRYAQGIYFALHRARTFSLELHIDTNEDKPKEESHARVIVHDDLSSTITKYPTSTSGYEILVMLWRALGFRMSESDVEKLIQGGLSGDL